MSQKVKAAVLHTPDSSFSIQEVELAELQPGEVRVKVEASGVCHTDIFARHHVSTPSVLGHEGVGIIEETGPGVDNFQVGQRVIISYPWCDDCAVCRNNRPWLCENLLPLCFGGARLDGSKTISLEGTPISSAFFQQSSFASHAITLARDIVSVDEDVAPAILAALPCGIQTGAGAIMNSFSMEKGQSLLVIGAGAVGLSAVMAAVIVGASPIIVADIHDSRLSLAKDLGADYSINVKDPGLVLGCSDIIPGGVDYILDTSGREESMLNGFQCLAREGTLGIVTTPDEGLPNFELDELFLRGASLQGIIQGSSIPGNFIPRLIEYYRDGRFPVDRLVKTYPFAEINRAIDDSLSGETIKPVLVMPD